MSVRRRVEKLEAEAAKLCMPAAPPPDLSDLVAWKMRMPASSIALTMAARKFMPLYAWPLRGEDEGPKPLKFDDVCDPARFEENTELPALVDAFQAQAIERYGDRDVFVVAVPDGATYTEEDEKAGRVARILGDELTMESNKILRGSCPDVWLRIEGVLRCWPLFVRSDLGGGDWCYVPDPVVHAHQAAELFERARRIRSDDTPEQFPGQRERLLEHAAALEVEARHSRDLARLGGIADVILDVATDESEEASPPRASAPGALVLVEPAPRSAQEGGAGSPFASAARNTPISDAIRDFQFGPSALSRGQDQ